ncbi:MAG: response regulator transcription factor, partial [Treponema sp.]|nr:response regulator transcription factor [Treponema sp.]
MENKTSIVIVEDHPVMRNGLAAFFAGTGRWEVLGTASTVVQAKELLTGICPDLILLDIQLEDGWGLDIIPWLNEQNGFAKQADFAKQAFAVYTVFDDCAHVGVAMKMGVKAYITKRRSESELEEALLKAVEGHIYIDDTAQAKLKTVDDLSVFLTNRETEVLILVKNG